jgi:hypothetical protein
MHRKYSITSTACFVLCLFQHIENEIEKSKIRWHGRYKSSEFLQDLEDVVQCCYDQGYNMNMNVGTMCIIHGGCGTMCIIHGGCGQGYNMNMTVGTMCIIHGGCGPGLQHEHGRRYNVYNTC